jgi:hypothetical protein
LYTLGGLIVPPTPTPTPPPAPPPVLLTFYDDIAMVSFYDDIAMVFHELPTRVAAHQPPPPHTARSLLAGSIDILDARIASIDRLLARSEASPADAAPTPHRADHSAPQHRATDRLLLGRWRSGVHLRSTSDEESSGEEPEAMEQEEGDASPGEEPEAMEQEEGAREYHRRDWDLNYTSDDEAPQSPAPFDGPTAYGGEWQSPSAAHRILGWQQLSDGEDATAPTGPDGEEYEEIEVEVDVDSESSVELEMEW